MKKLLLAAKQEFIDLVLSISTSVLLLLLFTNLFQHTPRITGANYVWLVMISLVFGFIVYHRRDIKVFDLKNLKVILEKAQKVKTEINKTTFDLAKLVASLSSYSSGSWLNRKS